LSATTCQTLTATSLLSKTKVSRKAHVTIACAAAPT
jgi:hypothetical protein